MSWIVANWRLKLLSVVLAIGLLAAVAFIQNPVRVRTIAAPIKYANQPTDLVLVNPQPSVNVDVSGLATAVSGLVPNAVTAEVDLKNLKKGHANLPVTPRLQSSGLTVLNERITIPVEADDLKLAQLGVEVRTPNVLPGFSVTTAQAECGNSSLPCKVTVVGPARFLDGLKAFVNYDSKIDSSFKSPSQPVQFELAGRPFDVAKTSTIPQMTRDPTTVLVHIDVQQTTFSRSVVLLDGTPVRPPPPGFRVTRIVISPNTITITGPANVLSGIETIALPAVDLGDRGAGDAVFTVNVQLPDLVTSSTTRVRITYTIQPNPNLSPSPR
ncbi:MAG TPA: CdaR family protein [Candidatus Acidoferrales bacterium]|nr:CdaR family protein [Candidatus Acidoferrales bacterium]